MKKLTVLLLIFALALPFTACGSDSEAPAPTAAPATAVPATEAPAQPTEAPAVTEAPTEAPAEPETDPLQETVDAVLALEGEDVSVLYDLIGEPTGGKEYASSCLVQGGQDGVWYYDGFTVYTLLSPDGAETVYYCELDS